MADDKEFQQAFHNFAKFGNPKSEGKDITLSNADKWFKQAGVIDGKKITTTDTGITFNKFKSINKTLDFRQFVVYVEALCKEKKLEFNEIRQKLTKCNAPGTSGTANAEKSNVVDRLTDTSKYTGAHKERFDESGKGKGKEGRVDEADTSGYVSGYKHKDTYEKK